jgi:hypothetical protein
VATALVNGLHRAALLVRERAHVLALERPIRLLIGVRSSLLMLARNAGLLLAFCRGGRADSRSVAWTSSDSSQRARLPIISTSPSLKIARARRLVNSTTATVFPSMMTGAPT